MRSLKNHFGVIFPLIALLFCIQFITLVGNVIKDYEKLMSEDYNIIVVSSKDLNSSNIKPLVSDFESIERLSTKSVLDRLSKDISAKNLNILQNSLPKFYSIKLQIFPSVEYMEEIKAKLLKVNGVSRVETFSKTHNKIYKILNLIKKISEIFSILIVILGLMLVLKQMRIWLYEHKERIDIMTLFGASFWLKSGVLYKMAVVDSIIATIIVTVFYYLLPDFNVVSFMMDEVGLKIPNVDIIYEGGRLLAISLALSIIAVSLVMREAKKNSI
ncbi:FtsX-like permease family protein [Campylobacter sp. RM16187]|uniref:FtsX-like permease family protein n=1 Tax=Campylobacter sp. RM16187 TaxID=1660063 RepID=UPI0021B6A435|nr:FtsX-like permease family protein [Campylobacter sp. RM16187]QKG28939.1 cell division protein FtsX [Campylobacter sp. RM16187]